MNLKLPISKNNCLTIEKLYDLKMIKILFIVFLKILKKNKKKISKLKLMNKIYDVCINQ